MPKRLTRKGLIAGAAPLVAAGPLARLALADESGGDQHHPPLHPPPALPHRPGRVRKYTLTALDKEIEVAPGVFFPAWTYNGTVPGPVIRATEGDLLRVRLVNAGSHPHTIHFHGIHPADMDGVFEIVGTG